MKHWHQKSNLLFDEAILESAYKVISWGKRKQLTGVSVQYLFIFLRLLGKLREFLGYRKHSQSIIMGYHQHIPAHTKEDGLASVLEMHSVQARSHRYWQSDMRLDSSVHAKLFGYCWSSMAMDILIGGHIWIAVKLCSLPVFWMWTNERICLSTCKLKNVTY